MSGLLFIPCQPDMHSIRPAGRTSNVSDTSCQADGFQSGVRENKNWENELRVENDRASVGHTVEEGCPWQMHSSLPLWVMWYSPPVIATVPVQADAPERRDMAMLTFRGSDEMMVATYLHRLDAALSSPSLKEAGRLWPVNLQEIHLHDFMEQNGCLRIAINYAFAADRKRLAHDGRQFLLMTYLTEQFAVPREQWDHFSVQFSDCTCDEINSVYARADLSNFASTRRLIDGWSDGELAEAADEARGRIPAEVHIDELGRNAFRQVALYDPETGDWNFVDLD